MILRLIEQAVPCLAPPVPVESIRSVLVVDLNYLGDMLMSSPVYRAFKEHLPEARVESLGLRIAAPALRANPFIDTIHLVKGAHFATALGHALAARKHRHRLVLQLNTSLKTNILLFIAGRHYRLGYNYAHRGCLNNIRVPLPTRTARQGNRVDECVGLLEKAFGWSITNRRMIFEVSPRAVERVALLLRQRGVGTSDLLVGLHTNCRQDWDRRRWGQRQFAEVARTLHTRYGARVVFTGGEDDRDYVAGIIRQIGNNSGVLDFSGRTITLEELGALLSRLNLFVTINTGPMHIAVARETPTVAIIGGTPASVVAPQDTSLFQYIMDPALESWDPTVLHPRYVPRIGSISPAQVLNKIDLLLHRHASPADRASQRPEAPSRHPSGRSL